MKQGIHPKTQKITVTCVSCGTEFEALLTKKEKCFIQKSSLLEVVLVNKVDDDCDEDEILFQHN